LNNFGKKGEDLEGGDQKQPRQQAPTPLGIREKEPTGSTASAHTKGRAKALVFIELIESVLIGWVTLAVVDKAIFKFT
jgi:hypothetical protein